MKICSAASNAGGQPGQDAVAGASCSGFEKGKSDPRQDASGTHAVAVASSLGSGDRDELAGMIMPDWETLTISRGDHLPHWHCKHAIYHVTFRLADAVPQTALDLWREERENIVCTAKQLKRPLSEAEEARLLHLHSEKVESYLDSGHGACYLADQRIASVVADSLRHFDGVRYRLHAWCIMPNHVHVIFQTMNDEYTVSDVTHSWKSFSALQANRLLQRRGTFWQGESYDHIIRTSEEYVRQVRYVWENPDMAGLRGCLRWVLQQGVLRGDVDMGVDPGQDAPGTVGVAGASCSGFEGRKRDPGQDAPGTMGEPDHA